MYIFYILLSTGATVLITIYLSILIIGLIMDFINKYKSSKQDLIKKYDSGYKEMFLELRKSRDYKNDDMTSFEEDSLYELKTLIDKRINAIKGN